jgi:hypothetical protein
MYRPPNNDDDVLAVQLRNRLKEWPADRVIVMDELLSKLGFRAGDRSAEMEIGARLRRHGFERVKKRVDGAPRMVWRRR